jgi:hypothetical protein
MAKSNEKPLTLKDLVKYNHDVLFPYMEETFATKGEFKKIVSKEDIKILNKKLDSISEDLKKTNKLESRVVDIENVLNMPALKK